MNQFAKRFPDRLIGCEKQTPVYREAYEREVRAMLERRIGGIKRAAYVFSAIFCAAMAVLFAAVALSTAGEIRVWATIGFSLGSVSWAAFATLFGWIAITGRLMLKSQPPAMAGMAWGFTVIFVTIYLVVAPTMPDSVVAVRMLLSGLVFLVMAAVFMLASRTEQAELRTREKLLEIEYRLAQLNDRLGKRNEENGNEDTVIPG